MRTVLSILTLFLFLLSFTPANDCTEVEFEPLYWPTDSIQNFLDAKGRTSSDFSAAANRFNCKGEYHEALQYMDSVQMQENVLRMGLLKYIDNRYLRHYKPVDAIGHIVKHGMPS